MNFLCQWLFYRIFCAYSEFHERKTFTYLWLGHYNYLNCDGCGGFLSKYYLTILRVTLLTKKANTTQSKVGLKKWCSRVAVMKRTVIWWKSREYFCFRYRWLHCLVGSRQISWLGSHYTIKETCLVVMCIAWHASALLFTKRPAGRS